MRRALALVLAFARGTYPIGPADITVSAQFALPGETALVLPPLGRVSAHTHWLPIGLGIMPAQLRITSVGDLLKTLDLLEEPVNSQPSILKKWR